MTVESSSNEGSESRSTELEVLSEDDASFPFEFEDGVTDYNVVVSFNEDGQNCQLTSEHGEFETLTQHS